MTPCAWHLCWPVAAGPPHVAPGQCRAPRKWPALLRGQPPLGLWFRCVNDACRDMRPGPGHFIRAARTVQLRASKAAFGPLAPPGSWPRAMPTRFSAGSGGGSSRNTVCRCVARLSALRPDLRTSGWPVKSAAAGGAAENGQQLAALTACGPSEVRAQTAVLRTAALTRSCSCSASR